MQASQRGVAAQTRFNFGHVVFALALLDQKCISAVLLHVFLLVLVVLSVLIVAVLVQVFLGLARG